MPGDEVVARVHPYNKREVIPSTTKILIVGTCPPPRFENSETNADGKTKTNADSKTDDFDFYYGSRDNQFWLSIMPAIFGNEFPDCRKDWRGFLRKKRIWMCDILETFTREHNDAKDTNLRPVAFCDLASIFGCHSHIDTLIFTGVYAEKWTRARMISQNLISYQDWRVEGKMPRLCDLKLDLDGTSRVIRICTLPSPTPSSDRRYKLDTKIQMYRKQLG